MAVVYDYNMAVWLRLEVPGVSAEFEEELLEYLQDEFQINKLEVVDDDDAGEDEVTVSLAIQLTLDEPQMEEEEPTEEAIAEFDDELRAYLSQRYEINYMDVMDDSPHSYLLGERED